MSEFVEPTDVLWEPQENRDAPWEPVLCKHCGKWLGLHWKHEDGRITCTRPKGSAQLQETPK